MTILCALLHLFLLNYSYPLVLLVLCAELYTPGRLLLRKVYDYAIRLARSIERRNPPMTLTDLEQFGQCCNMTYGEIVWFKLRFLFYVAYNHPLGEVYLHLMIFRLLIVVWLEIPSRALRVAQYTPRITALAFLSLLLSFFLFGSSVKYVAMSFIAVDFCRRTWRYHWMLNERYPPRLIEMMFMPLHDIQQQQCSIHTLAISKSAKRYPFYYKSINLEGTILQIFLLYTFSLQK